MTPHTLPPPDRLHRFLAASPVVMYAVEVVGGEYRTLWASPNVERLLGYTLEEALAPGWWESNLHPEDRDDAVGMWSEALKGGEQHRHAYRFIRKDGSVLRVLDTMEFRPGGDHGPPEVVGSWADMTELHEAEVLRREGEERLRLAMKAAAQGLWDLDLVSGSASVSPEYARMLGHDPDTFAESVSTLMERMHPEDRARARERVERYLAGQESEYRSEFRLRTAQGGWCWILSVGETVERSPDGRPLRMLGTHTDVTALKESETTAREAAHFSERLLEHVSEGVVACDAEGRLTLFNQVARLWHGVGPDASLDPGEWSEHYDLRQPDGTTPLQAEEIPLFRAHRGEQVREAPMCIAVPGKPLRFLTATGGPLHDADGTLLGALVLMRDVTAEREAAAAVRLREAALMAASTAIVITDREGVIEWANPAFTDLTGFTLDEALGHPPGALVGSGEQSAEFYREMWSTILSGKTWEGEVMNRRRDGTVYPEALSITPVRDGEGEIRHFVAFKRDLTEERAQQGRLLHSQKMESVGRLAGGVAHDFNNLLTVIRGTVDLALSGLSSNDPLLADLEEVKRAGERASALTRQLLAFSRQQVLRPQVLNPNDVVSGLSRMLARLLGEDVTVVMELGPEVGSVRVDEGQLEQVVVNLAVNARDAMPRGGTLTLRTAAVDRSQAPAGPHVVLSVTDTGVGIPESLLARVFEPFFTTKEAGKGTGLGLSTVYGIVEQSGGTVEVESVVEKGTTFHVILPRVEAPGMGDGVGDGESSGGKASGAGTGTRTGSGTASALGTVLVVDDEAGLRGVATRILRRAGYTVRVAASGAEALGMMAQDEGSVDLLLTDVVMPGMSGPELFRTLRARHPGLRVLFTSGYTDDTLIRHGLNGEGVPFLQKPYSMGDLTRAVEKALQR